MGTEFMHTHNNTHRLLMSHDSNGTRQQSSSSHNVTGQRHWQAHAYSYTVVQYLIWCRTSSIMARQRALEHLLTANAQEPQTQTLALRSQISSATGAASALNAATLLHFLKLTLANRYPLEDWVIKFMKLATFFKSNSRSPTDNHWRTQLVFNSYS